MAGRKSELKINRAYLENVLKGQPTQDLVLRAAVLVCDEANRYADSIPRSGRHPGDDGPHFVVMKELGRNRARYTVRPNTAFGTWLVQRDPARFMATLNAGRAVGTLLGGR